MALVTTGDLITFALKTAGVLGIGQTADTSDTTDMLTLLQSMIGQWQRKRWLVPDDVDVAATSTGATSYTVGPAGAFVMPRPDRIESAFARLLNGSQPLDYPLAIIQAREDYNQIQLKSLSTFPEAVFYDSAYPVGTAYFWPVPVANLWELHLTVKNALPTYTSLSDSLNLTPEYTDALIYGLAIRAAMNYGLDPRPAHAFAYRAALNTIRMANTQVATLGMPGGIAGRQRGTGGSMVGAGLSRAFTLDGGSVLT